MVGMRVIEADDVLAALAAFALNADEFFRIDAVAVVWRIFAHVAAAGYVRDGLRTVVLKTAEQHATALVGIGFLAVLAQGDVGRLGNLEHVLRLEVRLRR